MIKILLATAAVAAMTSAANAEVSFVKGTASASYATFGDAPFGTFDININTAFDIGNYGFQVGAENSTLVGDAPNFSFSEFNLHYYRNLANGDKAGAFVAGGSFFGPFGSNQFGVEGMFDLGSIDLEARFGYMSGYLADDAVGEVVVAAYFDVNQSLELNASVAHAFAFDGEGSGTAYRIGAQYGIGNSGYSVTLGYTGFEDGPGDLFDFGISWEFGPRPEERLFGNFSYFASLFAA